MLTFSIEVRDAAWPFLLTHLSLRYDMVGRGIFLDSIVAEND
ncbi:MAG: hypothetical protein AAF655_06355 [Bacteroidota bacterium]